MLTRIRDRAARRRYRRRRLADVPFRLVDRDMADRLADWIENPDDLATTLYLGYFAGMYGEQTTMRATIDLASLQLSPHWLEDETRRATLDRLFDALWPELPPSAEVREMTEGMRRWLEDG